MKYETGKNPQRRRPVYEAAQEWLRQVIGAYGLTFLANSFGVSVPTISRWTGENTDFVTRFYSLLRELVDMGRRDLAIAPVRILCAAVDCIPVKRRHLDAAGLSSMAAAFATETAEGADVARAMASCLDGTVTTEECSNVLKEIDEQIEALEALKNTMRQVKEVVDAAGGMKRYQVP